MSLPQISNTHATTAVTRNSTKYAARVSVALPMEAVRPQHESKQLPVWHARHARHDMERGRTRRKEEGGGRP